MPASAAASRAAASRWTDEEHDILVIATNKQIEIEAKDKSQEIPWSRHWQQVSLKLEEFGYIRTPPACNGYWKRTIESQKASEEAAGPRWDDCEHQILLGMTEDQLALESADSSSIIPWQQHWKKVSLRLKTNGYTRSVEACAAYWHLLENNFPLATGSEMDVELQSHKDNGGVDHGFERDTPSQEWTDAEHDNLTRLLRIQRQHEKHSGAEELSDIKYWTLISRLHQQSGFDRTWEACKRHYWEEFETLRSLSAELPGLSSKEGTASTSARSNPTTTSGMCSPVNALENNLSSDRPAYEEPTSTNSLKARSQTLNFSPNSLFRPAKQTTASDSETSGFENDQLQGAYLTELEIFT